MSPLPRHAWYEEPRGEPKAKGSESLFSFLEVVVLASARRVSESLILNMEALPIYCYCCYLYQYNFWILAMPIPPG